MQLERSRNRLVVVSNRLPWVMSRSEGNGGEWSVKPGSGGLVTALAPVLRNRGGLWIGWPGAEAEPEEVDAVLQRATRRAGYELRPVRLTAEERDLYYHGFSNEILWPLFHDLQWMANFDTRYWAAYQSVNRKFAEAIAEHTEPDDFVWVHDYQLLLVARELRAMGVQTRLGFFLHIPFPPLDIFLKLPWRWQLLRAVLEYDLIGLQTLRDRRNFLQCIGVLLKDAKITGRGQVIRVRAGERDVRLGAFPIGIDFHEFARGASTKEVTDGAWYLHQHFPDRQIVLGVDRLDYTKGIPNKLSAFENVLERYPELCGRLTMIQVVIPSREEVPRYAELKEQIERRVGQINGRFTRSNWVPVHYHYHSLARPELLAHYRAAEIALVTPLKDGMNLVAKEYCAASLEEQNGVLILSEFAGAVAQLQHGALLVNPYDIEGVADAINRAATMTPGERRKRMHRLRASLRRYDIFWWVDSFLRAAIARDLRDFPIMEDYVPQEPEPETA